MYVKDIIYPEFLQCLEYESDEYWRRVYENMAYGVMPGKTYISNAHLCCKHNNKTHALKIYANAPKLFREELHSFLHDTLEIRTSDEIRQMVENIDMSTEVESWTAIKKKNVKEIFIDRFVIEMQKKHRLTTPTARDLLADIYIHILFKFIQPSDIELQNGRIQSISGVSFDRDKYTIKGAYSTALHTE
jgi:hypothetical protein